MNPERPLFWHQGLFLQPQHFQRLDLFHQSQLNAVRKAAAPFLWGIGSLEIEKAALSNRTFRVTGGEMIFPDGTHIAVNENALIQTRTFDDGWIGEGVPFTIYAGIKKLDHNGKNVSVIDKAEDIAEVTGRFVARPSPEELNDLHGDGPPGQVKLLQYSVRIFWDTEKELLGNYVFMPIAQIVRDGAEIILAPTFTPPLLAIEGNDNLLKLTREIRNLLAAKSYQLEEYKAQRGINAAEFGSRDMVFLLALRSINRYVPALAHIIETGSVHPWQAYGLLRQLIGELSCFSENFNVLGRRDENDPGLPAYDHWDIYGCFAKVHEILATLIEEITAGPEYIITLDYDDTYYAAQLPATIFQTGNHYYLALTTATDPEELKVSLSNSAKLSSREHLPILIARALPGIRLEYLATPPQKLPKRANTCYFHINNHDDQWATVEQSKNLALYWDTAPDDLKAELMIVEP